LTDSRETVLCALVTDTGERRFLGADRQWTDCTV
jgi:hypothetical protein